MFILVDSRICVLTQYLPVFPPIIHTYTENAEEMTVNTPMGGGLKLLCKTVFQKNVRKQNAASAATVVCYFESALVL